MPDPKILLRGYKPGAAHPIYQVVVENGRLVEQLVDSNDNPTPGTAPSNIQRIVFYDLAQTTPLTPLWLVPLLPNAWKISVGTNGVLNLQCSYRCWLHRFVFAGAAEERVDIACTIGLNSSGAPTLNSMSINGLQPDMGGFATLPPPFTSDTLLRLSASSEDDPLPICGVPLWATSAGMKTDGVFGAGQVKTLTQFPFAWSFELYGASTSGFQGAGLVLSKAVPANDNDITVKGFGVQADRRSYPLIEGPWPTAGAPDTARAVILQQRLGSGYSPDTFGAPPLIAWRLSIPLAKSGTDILVNHFSPTITRPFLDSLSVVEPDNGLSLMPTFSQAAPDDWRADYVVLDAMDGTLVTRNVQYMIYGTTAGSLLAKTLQPAAAPGTPPAGTVPSSVELRELRSQEAGATFSYLALPVTTTDLFTDADFAVSPQSPAWNFALQPWISKSGATLQRVKMGALELNFLTYTGTAPATLPNKLLADANTRVWAPITPLGRTCPGRDISFLLPLAGIAPGGQDAVPGEGQLSAPGDDVFNTAEYSSRFRRADPIVLDAGQASSRVAAPGIQFVATLTEKTSPGIDRIMQIALEMNGDASGSSTLDAYILDPEPFLVARVATAGRAGYADALTDRFALWTNSAGDERWQIATGGSFTLQLPPQGVGEAMHKRTGCGDILEGQPIDFRFTPPAEFNLASSYFAQRFAEAPWNLRRLLGYPGQRDPGPEMNSALFELVYGMDTSLQRPAARLAEIGALLGDTAGPQHASLPWKTDSSPQSTTYTDARERWSLLQPALRSRLAALTPWRERQTEPPLFSSNEKLSVHLRENATLAPPVEGVTGREFRPDGLHGGWSWGFESANILNAVLADRDSVTAETGGLIFSSLGGWGYQRSTYDGGRSTIASAVSMGRTETLVIERIGRIEPFWNRAKHVIVYERTTAATRQFYLEQLPLRGVPVLRKTQEYVELIEAERGFPENGSPANNPGFVYASHFEGTPPRIPVDSTWGGDVENIGWQVPLWNPRALPTDVYPRPNVGLLLAGQEDTETVRHIISNPQLLHFYTNTESTTGNNPDLWVPVEGISYAAIPKPSLTAAPYPLNGDIPEDDAIRDGLQDFTFRFDPAPAPSNVVASRSGTAVSARLANVTVMRGFNTATPAAPDNVVRANGYRTELANAFATAGWTSALSFAEPLAPSAKAASSPPLYDRDAALESLSTALTRLGGKLNGVNSGTGWKDVEDTFLAAFQNRIFQQWKSFAAPALSNAIGAATGATTRLQGAFNDLQKTVDWTTGALLSYDVAKEQLGAIAQEFWQGEGGAQYIFDRLHFFPALGIDGILSAVQQLQTGLDTALLELQAAESAIYACATFPPTGADFTNLIAVLDNLRSVIDEQAKVMESAIDLPLRPWLGEFPGNTLPALLLGTQAAALRATSATILALRNSALDDAEKAASTLDDVVTAFTTFAEDATTKLTDETASPLPSILIALSDQPITQRFADLGVSFTNAVYNALLADTVTTWEAAAANIPSMLQAFAQVVEQQVPAILSDIFSQASATGFAATLFNALKAFLLPDLAAYLSSLNDRFQQAKAVIDQLKKLIDPAALAAELERLESDLGHQLSLLAQHVQLSEKDFRLRLPTVGVDPLLRLLRAFGEPPRVPDLTFTLPTLNPPQFPALPHCGFYFFSFPGGVPLTLPQVNLSPLLAMASRLLGQIDIPDPLHLHFPATGLLDRLLPPDLSQFDLRQVINKLGGLELANLFPGLKLPNIANDNIRLTHGIEPSSRSAWMQADFSVPFGSAPVTVFSLAGITLRLRDANFTGQSRIDAHAGGVPVETTWGAISGNWDLSVGSFPIATLEGCKLIFEQGGGFRFQISASQVKPQAVLQFLADLLSSIVPDLGGFTTSITPTSALSTLELPLPDIGGGTFGISNLSLGFYFGLNFEGDFTITTGLHIARPTSPFTLTVFILGGAGFFETDITYNPRSSIFRASVSVGIFASASLSISLGPVSGGIFAYFGINASFVAETKQSPTLTIAIVILFRGEVSLLGFISVGLLLSLEAIYTNGGGLSGRGTVSFHIKIGFFFHIDVSTSVTYQFKSTSKKQAALAESPKAAAPAVNPWKTYADNHEEMFV